MKSTYAIAAALLLSISTYAQKDELKALKRIYNKEKPDAEDFKEAGELLAKAEPLMANADEEQKVDFHYYKAMYAMVQMNQNPMTAMANLRIAVDNFNKVTALEKNIKRKEYTELIKSQIFPELKAAVVNMAGEMGKQQQFGAAAPLYETAYRISPKDTVYLYNAAAYAVNAKNYDMALKHYEELDRLGFTGTGINYTAKNDKGEIEYYGDKKMRDLLVANKTHTEPGIHRDPSRRGDIIKNIALIYIQKGDKENAKKALAKARKENPKDNTLILAEAEAYLAAGDHEAYKNAITEVINNGSKDPNLFFNLGVTTAKSGQVAEAEKYYMKAIELKPDFTSAHLNLGILQLHGEDKIVNEMNSLGTSPKDIKRYDELKKQRDDKYRKAIKHLERAHQLEPGNENVKTTLGTLYQGLDMEKEYNALKAKK